MGLLTKNRRWGLVGLLLIFGAVFVIRGPGRALQESPDLAHLYAASMVWLEGGDPYDGERCVVAMERAGYHKPEHVSTGSFYPPPTIAVLSPLGLMEWDAARLAWLTVNLLACVVLACVLANWLDWPERQDRWLLAVLLMVAWGPVSTTLSLGQLSLASAACVFVGLLLVNRGKAWQAGLLIGLGCLIKPQLGLGFWLLILLRRDWLAVGSATAVIAAATGIGIWRLMQAAPGWASQLASNIAEGKAPGTMLDASMSGSMRYQMIDMHPLLHLIIPHDWVSISALVLVALLAAVAIFKLIRLGLRERTLLAVSGVGLLILLPVYHRYYDAVLLLPLLVLALNELRRNNHDRLMLVIALAMLPLLLPLPAILVVLRQKGVIAEALHASWPWQNVVLQHQSWCLLIASVALVVWTWRQRSGLESE